MRLVHLARASTERAIRKNGLRGAKWVVDVGGRIERIDRGVLAMPVLTDWSATFQWLRELRRWHDERMIAVHFRVPDDELVLVGRYGARHDRVRASLASRRVSSAPGGMEIIVERPIGEREIVSLREMGQLVGWTESPVKSRWSCICRFCLPPGVPDRMRRIRAMCRQALMTLRQSKDPTVRKAAIWTLETARESAGERGLGDALDRKVVAILAQKAR